jgi:chaperonin GroEL
MNNEVKLGYDAKLAIKRGIDIVVEAAKPTLGAIGKSAILDQGGLDPIISDDGVTIARSINLKDRYENMGALLMRKVSSRTNDEAGDGTTTSMVLAQAFIDEALNEIGNDSSKIHSVRERLQKGLEVVKEKLKDTALEVKDNEDVKRIATISSLDDEIGGIISSTIEQVGKTGVITVESGTSNGYSCEVVKGMRFDNGLLSHYFINDAERGRCVLDNPWVLLVDRKVSTNKQIQAIFEAILKTDCHDVLLIAETVEGEALASLVVNHQSRHINIACVQSPFIATRKKDFMQDIATLTGATVISEEAGVKMEDATLDMLGKADRVIVTKDSTTIAGGRGNEDEIRERVSSIQQTIDSSEFETDKELGRKRIAYLTEGIGVIRVGAFTDTEMRAKKYKVEDAINATRAALEEGIVAGGGTALAKIAIDMEDPMFKKALITPLKQMAINAGMEWYDVVASVQNRVNYTEQKYWESLGYNFKTKQLESLIKTGVIDPVKVTRLALESAISIASTLITVETVVALEPKKEDDK